MDLYKILGVSKDATKEEIKQRYYKLAKKLHPDAGNVKDDKQFKAIALAYSVLSDDEKRSRYDRGESVDDVGVDNRRAKLTTALTELLVKAIKSNDVRYSDIVASMRAEVKAAITEVEALLEQAKDAVKKVDEALARFEGEIELVQMILTSTRGGILRQQEKVEADLDCMKEIYDKVNKMKYRVDQRPKGEKGKAGIHTYTSLYDEFNKAFGGGFGK